MNETRFEGLYGNPRLLPTGPHSLSSKAKYGISGSMWSYTGVAGNFGGEPMYLFMIRTPNSPARRLKKIRGVINPRSHQLITAYDLHGEAKKEAKPGEAKKEKTSEFLR